MIKEAQQSFWHSFCLYLNPVHHSKINFPVSIQSDTEVHTHRHRHVVDEQHDIPAAKETGLCRSGAMKMWIMKLPSISYLCSPSVHMVESDYFFRKNSVLHASCGNEKLAVITVSFQRHSSWSSESYTAELTCFTSSLEHMRLQPHAEANTPSRC